MAAAVDALWPEDAPLSGLVVTRYHHVPPAYKAIDVGSWPRCGCSRGGALQTGGGPALRPPHRSGRSLAPVPDAAGERAAQRILDLTQA